MYIQSNVLCKEEMYMLIKNCRIVHEDRIEKGAVSLDSSKIEAINPEYYIDDEVIDAEGLYLAPGFIDIHIHGAGGYDTMDGTYEAINNISKTIVNNGTTSYLPTTMTCDMEDIKKAISAISEAVDRGTEGANVLGAHLEGPFISLFAIGAQNPKFIKWPSIETFVEIVQDKISYIKAVTLAPEIEGAKELIKFLCKNNIVVSAGHTKATYEETIEGIKCGISHATHLFNAMTGFQHREPGVVGAIFDTDITTEAICDGIHIAYPSIRVSLKQKTTDNMILITDAMSACGMAEGTYSLGGQAVFVKEGAARLENGALAGSILTLDKAIKNVLDNTKYELYEIVKMATSNAARHCGVAHRKGKIKEGYDADLVLFDENIDIKLVIVNGKIVVNKLK